jgi:hypothetical protein
MSSCKKCQVELSEVNWVKSLRDKNCQICKSCHLEKGREWRRTNKEKSNSYSTKAYYKDPKAHHKRVRVTRARVRLQTVVAYGGKCNHCGISDIDVLDLDHIENDGAKERKENLFAYNLYRKLKKEGFPTGRYQILCKNCNWKKELLRRRVL